MKNYLILLFLLHSIPLLSQRHVSFKDDFDHSQHGWLESDGENSYSKIEDGHYIISHKRTTGGYVFHHNFPIIEEKDFYMEARLMQVSGVTNHGYGIIWGAKNGNNCYNFLISSTGYYEIGGFKEGKYFSIQKWEKVEVVRPQYQYNTIAVRKKGSQLTFIINDKEVHTAPAKAFMGTNFGFNLQNQMQVHIDYLKLEYNAREISLVKDALHGYRKENLGTHVNSSAVDKSPKISHDGRHLYFTRQDHPANTVFEKDDAWQSSVVHGSGIWGKAVNMGYPINNKGHNFVVSISPDNNTLLLGNTYHEDGTKDGSGLSITHKTRNGWEIPQTVEIDDYYNDNQYVNFCLAPNRKILFMAIERKDSYGDQDLYYSILKSNDTWTKPKNMGASLNTKKKEFSPFLAADGRTLYFASTGHAGYGSADIFVSKRIGNGWNQWTKPKNLGPEINTELWDGYFTVPASGDYAYLVSKENTLGYEDIFRIKIHEEPEIEETSRDETIKKHDPKHVEIPKVDPKIKKNKPTILPEPVVFVHGKVYDERTKKPLGANIFYEDLDTHKELGLASSDPVSGAYKIVLPYGQHYGFRAEAKDHLSINANINIKYHGEYIEIERDLYLAAFKVGQTIRINNVFFCTK